MELVTENTHSDPNGEARTWLNTHKDALGLSWPQLARLTDLGASTLSAFAAGTYTGNIANVTANVLAYRDRLARQAEIATGLPTVPTWYDTPSSSRITQLLRWAQFGNMVLIVTVPGIGKTKTAERFAAEDPNVWLAPMSPSTAGVSTMLIEIAEAIGLGQVKGSPQQMARLIKGAVRGKNGLLIIDEAQELTEKALNELRSVHDQTGVGIALMGNETVVGQIEGRKSALAQIKSRFSIPHVQNQPMAGDMDALLDAWGICEQSQRDLLARIGMLPGALREVTHTIKIAAMAAGGAGDRLTLTHLRNAARQRNLKIGGL